MPEVSGLTSTATTRQGYRVVTESAGWEYHTILRRVEDDTAGDPVVEVVERWREDGGERDDLELKTTDTVVETLADRGVLVA